MQTRSPFHLDWKFLNIKGKVNSLSESSYLAVEKNSEISKGKIGADSNDDYGKLLVFDNKGLFKYLTYN
jgi:hypothetical protein